MTQPITAVLLGAGNRGYHVYGPYAREYPDELRFVAVAEPHQARRERFARAYNIPAERQFASWEDALARGQIADVLVNTTPDQTHHASTVAALQAGYDVLLEKPMATRLDHVVDLVQTAERTGRLLQVCHVLRYTSFFSALHAVLASGRLGGIITVEQRENVAYWHMAHSYVRGNWRNLATSSPMILAKCCHDLDILFWNMGRLVEKLQSFGSLIHFRPENAPAGATLRCTDGCPASDECPFDARRIYLNLSPDEWPAAVLSEEGTAAGLRRALETGPYGRCVYRCDNDVVDNQTVAMQFAGGASVVLFMHGHSYEEARTMRYDGTRATLRAKFDYHTGTIEVHNHLSNRHEEVEIPATASGHGGGDFGTVRSFIQAARGAGQPLTTARESLESHLLAFAAEESRLNDTVVDMGDFRRRAEGKTG